MPISDLEILQTAKLWADRHGEDAILEARKMVTHFQQLGDRDGADVWLRTILALETLRTILALETLRTLQPDRLS